MTLAAPLESSNTRTPGSLFVRNSRSKPKVPFFEGVFVQETAINKKQIIYLMRIISSENFVILSTNMLIFSDKL